MSVQRVAVAASTAADGGADEGTEDRTSSSSSYSGERQQTEATLRSADDGVTSSRTSCSSSQTLAAARMSPVKSSTGPEVVNDTGSDVWRLNGEPLRSVVQRAMTSNGRAPQRDDVISGVSERKSNSACSPTVDKNSNDVTPNSCEQHGKRRSPYTNVVTTSVVESGVLSNGSSNGDRTSADERHDRRMAVDLPTSALEHDELGDISDVIVCDSGNTRVQKNPYGEKKLDSAHEKQSADSLSVGIPRDCDVIKMAEVALPTRSSGCVEATPELEITENDVTGRRSVEEQRSSDVTGRVGKSREDNENRTRTGVKARQRAWKDVDTEMMCAPLGSSLSVWNSPTTIHETTTTKTTTRQKLTSPSEELMLDNVERQRRQASRTVGGDGTDSGAASVTWRYISSPRRRSRDNRVTAAGRHTSPSPIRRVTLSKHCNLVVFTTADEQTQIRSRPDNVISSELVHSSTRSDAELIAEGLQTWTDCATMQEPLIGQTATTDSINPFTSTSPVPDDKDTFSDDPAGDECPVVPADRLTPSTNRPDWQVSSVNQTVEIDSSPHQMSTQTSSFSTRSSSSGCTRVSQAGVISRASNVDRTTDLDHLISSLFDVTSSDYSRPDVENMSPLNADRQVQSTFGGDKPEVANDDVTDDVAVTSLPVTDDEQRRRDESPDRKHVSHGDDDVITTRCQSRQLDASAPSCSVVRKSPSDQHRCNESGDVGRKDSAAGAESTKTSLSEHRRQSLPANGSSVQASRDQQSIEGHVVGHDVTSRRGNVDVYVEKVFVESLATSIGKVSFILSRFSTEVTVTKTMVFN